MAIRSIEDLFKQYKNKVYGFILSHVCDAEIAKDLTQEVFLSLCIHKEKLIGSEDVNRYIFLTTKNKVIDYFRKIARDKNKKAAFIQTWEESQSKIEAQINEEHCLSILEEVINQLPPQQQIVYRLSKLQGHGLSEIAEKMKISSSTAKNHLVQANKFVRQNIKPDSIYIFLLLCNL